MNKQFDFSTLSALITDTYQLQGNPEGLWFDKLKTIGDADEHSLVFVDHKRSDKQELAEKTKAMIIICDPEVQYTPALQGKLLIQVAFPKLVFSIIGNKLFISPPPYGIHPTASIHPEAKIHPNSYIGPFTSIGKSTVGEGAVIHGNVFIYDRVEIGKNVIVNAGCSIGSDGYGYNKDHTGKAIQFPHVGGVILEDEVELGSNTCIDVGALGNTIIGYGSKIDNLVHIGHNVQVGKHVYIAAQTTIGGSSRIGDHTHIWMGISIADGIRIGEHAFIGVGSVVVQDIPARKKCFGNPARVFADNND